MDIIKKNIWKNYCFFFLYTKIAYLSLVPIIISFQNNKQEAYPQLLSPTEMAGCFVFKAVKQTQVKNLKI